MHLAPDDHTFFLKIATGYRATKVLFTATKLGVFDNLDDWASPSELAPKLGCHPQALEALLQALAAMHVIEGARGTFRNTPLARKHLVSSSPSFLGHTLSMHDLLWECWSNLEDVVRQGRPHKRLEELLGAKDQEFTHNYIRGMLPLAAGPAREVARLLQQDASFKTFLDVGGGPAAYSAAVLELIPDAQATLLDLETTLAVTRALVREAPYRDRLRLVAGNYLTSEYGHDFDVVLLSHVTHDENRDGLASMLQRAQAALAPGGRVAIHDWVMPRVVDERALPQAMFNLNLMVYTDGRLYTEELYRAALLEAGFDRINVRAVLPDESPNPTHLIVGHKLA